MKNKDNLFMTNRAYLFMAIAYLIVSLAHIYSKNYWTAALWLAVSVFMFVIFLYYRKKSNTE